MFARSTAIDATSPAAIASPTRLPVATIVPPASPATAALAARSAPLRSAKSAGRQTALSASAGPMPCLLSAELRERALELRHHETVERVLPGDRVGHAGERVIGKPNADLALSRVPSVDDHRHCPVDWRPGTPTLQLAT